MSDTYVLVCQRADSIPPVPSVSGYCTDCGGQVWISHDMRPDVDAGTMRPVCMSCLAAQPDKYGKSEFRLHSAQVDTLREHGVFNLATRFINQVNTQRRKQR